MVAKPNNMKTYDQATQCKKQHVKPCDDCPFRRLALANWLGGKSPAEYALLTSSDAVIDCHTKLLGDKPAQCAGAQIYRANSCKLVYPPNMVLAGNHKTVFSNAKEFLEHHTGRKLQPWQIRNMMHAAMQASIEAYNKAIAARSDAAFLDDEFEDDGD